MIVVLLENMTMFPSFKMIKWASMAAAVFWTLVYQISQKEISLSGFVYVNF